jgi:predicted amidohydrolase
LTTLTIAAAQALSVRGDVIADLEEHLKLAGIAAEKGAEIVVYPELSLTGYELDLAEELAFVEDDSRLEPLEQAAAEHQAILVAGAPARLASGLHIGAFLLYPDGRSEVYTKHHLYGGEHGYFQPAGRDPMVELRGEKLAFAICADTSHARHAQVAADRGASIYMAGVCFSKEGFEKSAGQMRDYARQHGMVTVLANSGGPATGFESAGNSSIWSERGGLLARLEGTGSGLAIATRGASGWQGEEIRA